MQMDQNPYDKELDRKVIFRKGFMTISGTECDAEQNATKFDRQTLLLHAKIRGNNYLKYGN